MADRFAHLTEAQRRAIRTIDRSVLVSAAAGSGKTTVLAERCAYLVCDLPAAERCSVSELLVVTFTDAAAGEMRKRIGDAIRQRIDENPRDPYLREQLYLLDSASISTIHSFCKTIVQKWFPQAGVDPQATVLNGDEAELLRRETLEELFLELYGRDDDLGRAFESLVDAYGAGEDRQIGEIALQVHAFISSLPDPDKWLETAVRQMDVGAAHSVAGRIDELQARRLQAELEKLIAYARHVDGRIRCAWPVAVDRAEAIEAVAVQLHGWHEWLAGSPLEWERVAGLVRGYEFERLKSRPRNLSDEDASAFDSAKNLYDRVKGLVRGRLQPLCRFTAEEYRSGLAQTAPFVQTFVQLVRELDDRYRRAKSDQAAMDFNDLQRWAHKLLIENGRADCPSAVARRLQRQYRYVLVDEFQDVDPLQDAILRMVSRESADPPAGNLFTVGDIKQSIYRFRLAEPELFAGRAAAFREKPACGETIHLQENFRSRSGVIEAVNLVFRSLMSKDFGGSEYDEAAELHAGASYPAVKDQRAFQSPAVEMHLLEPVTEQTRTDEIAQADDSVEDCADESADEELEGIEREAVLIGRRIRTWMGLEGDAGRWQVTGRPATPGGPPSLRPIEYRDIVILLRAMLHKAEPIAEILRRLGIPVRIEGGDDSLDSTEFRDVYSLLQVLDNPQQDIPLAAVLRSPMLGDPLGASDLLRMRLIDRAVPFHAAVRRYAVEGEDADLRERLAVVLARIDRLRTRMQREPVADVLWDIYEQTQYLAFVSGLPDGAQRRAQLIRIHELARQFGRFARQGLRRFLRFLDEMAEQERGGPPATAGGSGDDAVRIMTIHASKGLEFPVVILADLQKRFNMGDSHGVALLDRQMGLALQVADADRRIRYPTLLHQLACERARKEGLSEELRVLYVALTRAREHLVLVGRCPLERIETYRLSGAGAATSRAAPPTVELESAQCLLDWLLPVAGSLPAGVVDWSGRSDSGKLISVRVYERVETDDWRIPPAQRPETADTLARASRLELLPAGEPVSRSADVDELVASLKFLYPGLELTTLPARVSVSELKRAGQFDDDLDERVRRRHKPTTSRPTFMSDGSGELDAAGRGTATHRFLQLVDLVGSCDLCDLQGQREAMIAAGRMSQADAGAVDLDAIAWFMQTDMGRRIRRDRGLVCREVPFVSRVSPERIDPMVHARDSRDVLLVRGMVDLVLGGAAGLEVLDFKTDRVSAEGCEERAELYRMQLAYYSDALAAAWKRPVLRQWLVFMHARRVIDLGVPSSP